MSNPFSLDAGPSAPRLLVSVRDAGEASAAALAGADLVDAKDPARGALGALDPATVRAIVAAVGTRAITSAVAGESPDETTLAPRIAAMVETGTAYVKVAVRAGMADETLARAAKAAPGRLIAVLFAEHGIAPGLVTRLARAGFAGAMIDTAAKDGRRLADHCDGAALKGFTAACRAHGLVSGLAGSLAIADIPVLAGSGAHYFGFRGGLCGSSDRTRGLDPERVREAVQALATLAHRNAA